MATSFTSPDLTSLSILDSISAHAANLSTLRRQSKGLIFQFVPPPISKYNTPSSIVALGLHLADPENSFQDNVFNKISGFGICLYNGLFLQFTLILTKMSEIRIRPKELLRGSYLVGDI